MGLVHIYCGDGKGKTTAAVGLAVRMAGRGNTVVVARFLKTDDSGEVTALRSIPGIQVIPCEKEFGFVFAMDADTRKEAAEYNTKLFEKAVREAVSTCECSKNGLLVLDEIMAAMNLGMVPEEMVLEFLARRPENLEVVLTGRDPSEMIAGKADYISEIRKVCHPYEKGISARIGIEY